MIVNVSEAKANLSKLINLAFRGEEVIIAKNNLPLVELVIHKPKSKIVFGLLADENATNKLINDDSLLEEDDDINALFYDADIIPK